MINNDSIAGSMVDVALNAATTILTKLAAGLEQLQWAANEIALADLSNAPVPEPDSLVLLALGLVAVAVARKREQ